jgi:hypothetical protein
VTRSGADTSLTAPQVLLLRAALIPGGPGLAAWERWRRITDVDSLDPSSQWVLPLLYRTLRSQAVRDPALGRYENVYRHNWYKNHLAWRRLDAGLPAGDPTVAPCVVLRGLGLALGYYRDLGARPVCELDVAVPRERLPDVTRGLLAAGWSPCPAGSGGSPRVAARLLAETGHALNLVDGVFDHRLDGRCCVRVDVRGRPVFVMDPIHQLLHVLTRADDWDSRSSLLWIADAVTVILGSAVVRWDAIMDAARPLGQAPAVARALDRVRALLDMDLPGLPPCARRG